MDQEVIAASLKMERTTEVSASVSVMEARLTSSHARINPEPGKNFAPFLNLK